MIISGHTHETLAQPAMIRVRRRHDHRHRRRVHRVPGRARLDRDAVRDAGRAAGRDDRQLHAAAHRRHDPGRSDHAGGGRRLHRGARHVARAVGPGLQEGPGLDGRRPAAARAAGGAGRQPGDGRVPDDHRRPSAERSARDRRGRERRASRPDPRRQDGQDLVRGSVPRHPARHRPRSDPGLFAGDVLSQREGHPLRPGAGRRSRGRPGRVFLAGLRAEGRVRHVEAAVRPRVEPQAGHARAAIRRWT